MQPHKVVSQTGWLAARKAHLATEKKFTAARDELSRRRDGGGLRHRDTDWISAAPCGVRYRLPAVDRAWRARRWHMVEASIESLADGVVALP